MRSARPPSTTCRQPRAATASSLLPCTASMAGTMSCFMVSMAFRSGCTSVAAFFTPPAICSRSARISPAASFSRLGIASRQVCICSLVTALSSITVRICCRCSSAVSSSVKVWLTPSRRLRWARTERMFCTFVWASLAAWAASVRAAWSPLAACCKALSRSSREPVRALAACPDCSCT